MTLNNHPALVILGAAVAAPLLAEIPIGVRIPVVVLEVAMGVLVGPQILGLIHFDTFLSSMFVIGTAAVLFTAGMEIDFEQIRGRPLSLALRGWLASLVLSLVVVALLHVLPGLRTPLMVTIALTTTGLGALLPILRDGGQLESPFGRLLLAAGTVGEVAPIVAVSVVLSQRFKTWQEFGFLLVFLGVVGLAAGIGLRARPSKLLAFLSRTMNTSTQVPVRLALLVLAAMLTISMEMGFEGVLGAFAAGMVVGLATRGEEGRLFRAKIDAVCFGWFTPFFFVGTGIQFDMAALTGDVKTMLVVVEFLLLFLLVRGTPLLLYRHDLSKQELLSFAFSASVASLALVVVITRIGAQSGDMGPDVTHGLVGAALFSSLIYPTLAGILSSRTPRPLHLAASPSSGKEADPSKSLAHTDSPEP